MICANCQFESPQGMKFCGHCGSPLKVLCASCGFENPPGFKFCGDCGTQLAQHRATSDVQSAAAALRSENRKEAERRHLTVMFCDLVGSTALSNKLDPEDLRAIVTEYQSLCQKIVTRYEGHIAQYLGDGVLIYFGYPIAHENDAHRAVSSGLSILEAVQQFNKRLAQSFDIRISVRIGIHTGHVVIGDMGGSGHTQQLALGATPNIAARLEGLAESDTLVISVDTYRLVQRFFSCEDKGQHQVKGIATPLQVYRVIRENVAKSRFEASQDSLSQAPLIGRDREIEKLKEVWEDAKKGNARIVLLSGEPGVGKSSVLQKFMAHVAADEGAWLNVHQCSPYHKSTAFYPIAETIKHVALQFEPDDAPAERITRLEGLLLQYGFALEEMVPLFANILAIPLDDTAYQPTPFSVEQQRQKIIGAAIDIYLERAREQHLLMVFEDIQWIDPATLEIITQLINQPPSLNILTVVSFRPEFTPPWRVRPHIIPLPLAHLNGDAVRDMIAKIANGKRLPAEVEEQIIQKTDGVPLFVEELTKMVLDSGMIREHDDHYELNGPVSALSIPSSLHDSLMARLDRMSHTKEIAQLGAAIGREFTYELINVVSNMQEKAMRACLNQLVEAELLLQRGAPPKAAFKFRHALIRDAAYQSLLKSQQQAFHQRIAQSLTQRLPDVAEQHPEIAAYHFEKARAPREATAYWTKAADKVRRHQAYDEALSFVDRGLALLQQLEGDRDRTRLELDLLAIQAPVLLMIQGFTSAAAYQASCRMKEVAELHGDDLSLFRALRGVITYELFAGKAQKALSYAQDALQIAESVQAPDTLAEAYRLIGQTSIYVGELALSLTSFDKAIALYEGASNDGMSRLIGADPGIFSLIQSSHVAWYLGYPDQARERIKRALAQADESHRPYSQALCLFIYSVISTCCGMTQETLKYTRRCVELSEEYGFTMFANEAKSLLGTAMVESGDTAEGLRVIHASIDARRRQNLIAGFYMQWSNLAAMCLKVGDIESGLQAVEEALSLGEVSDDRLFLSELYRFKGELLLAEDRDRAIAEAESCLEQSLRIARKQNAKSFELRSVMSLADLWQSQGKDAGALELVTDVYTWFSEGLETRDLREAKDMIDALNVQAPST